jgi:hypothetical protein
MPTRLQRRQQLFAQAALQGGYFIASLAIIATFFYPHAPAPLIFVTAVVAGVGFSGQWVFP